MTPADPALDPRLNALPYRRAVKPDGRIILTPLRQPPPTWDELCDDPAFADLPYQFDLNARGQIIMSPPPGRFHASFQAQIIQHLGRLLSGGLALGECGVQTADNVKSPDVAWVSRKRWEALGGHERSFSSVVPEICVEVQSPSNTRREMHRKKTLYLNAGVGEVWFCSLTGALSFFDASGAISRSKLCPAFPKQLDQ